MNKLTKSHIVKFLMVCFTLSFGNLCVSAQSNPSSLDFKIKKGSTHIFQIASTTIPNFQLESEIADWGNVKRNEDLDGDNIYDIEFTAPTTYTGPIGFVFSYTGINPFPFYSYTRQVKITANVVESVINTNDDFAIYDGEEPLKIYPLDNDYNSDGDLQLEAIASSSWGEAVISGNNEISFYPSEGFSGRGLITYVVEDPSGTKEEGNIYILEKEIDFASDTLYLSVSSENRSYIFLPKPGMSLISQSGKKGQVSISGEMSAVYQPISGRYGKDVLVFKDSNNETRTAIITVFNNSPDLDAVQDDYFHTAINQEITFNVSSNDLIDPASIVYSSPNLSNLGNGVFSYVPDNNFNGFKEFIYKVNTGLSLLTGKITIKIDDYLPAPIIYEFSTHKNQELILEYDVPIEGYSFNEISSPSYGNLEIFYNGIEINTECGTLSRIPKVIYTPNNNFLGFDEFEIEYCTSSGNCEIIKSKISIKEAANSECPCLTDCVYPGDANKDGIVNITDLLSVGLYIGSTGPSRNDFSIEWKGSNATNWFENQANNRNLKHIDADGDGVISSEDSTVIVANFGNYSTYIPSSINIIKKSPIRLIPLTNDVEIGDLFLIDIYVGDDANPVLDMHGLAFNLNLDPKTFDISSVIFIPKNDSWFSEGFGTMNMVRASEDGKISVGLSRTSGLPKSGKGIIGSLGVIVRDDLEGFRIDRKGYYFPEEIDIDLEEIIALDSKGATYTMPSEGATVDLIKPSNVIIGASLFDKTIIYPNPAKDFINVYLNGNRALKSVKIYDIVGRLIYNLDNISTVSHTISTSNFHNGIYILELNDGTETITKKVKISK